MPQKKQAEDFWLMINSVESSNISVVLDVNQYNYDCCSPPSITLTVDVCHVDELSLLLFEFLYIANLIECVLTSFIAHWFRWWHQWRGIFRQIGADESLSEWVCFWSGFWADAEKTDVAASGAEWDVLWWPVQWCLGCCPGHLVSFFFILHFTEFLCHVLCQLEI